MGTHFWGFEQQGVVPDIVTIGKPLGNGFPVAAVVTTANISAAFDDEGVEYFSTFGGNTVRWEIDIAYPCGQSLSRSCAAALAVLRAIDEDNLQGHARYVGEVLKGELRRAARECPHIGEVRGSGLFVGVEIVEGSSTENPAPLSSRIASQLVARLLLDHSMLTSRSAYWCS